MKIFSSTILASLFACNIVLAQEMSVEVNALGNLSLETNTIQAVNSYTGKAVMAKVAILPGQSYVFKSPIDVQQLEYIKGSGEQVQKNEAFAIIQGPEVHHFYRLFKLKKTLYQQSKALFENNQKLYQRKAISEQIWLDISNQFHEIRMEYDELTHFFDLVLSIDDEKEALTLAAPVAGIVQYSVLDALNSGNTIATFTPVQAIRLRVNLPINANQQPQFVNSEYCQLAINFTENANSGFYRTAWSEALRPECQLVLGQITSATPEYATQAYKVKQSSVFNSHGINYIFVQNKQRYEAVEVALVTAAADSYIVTSEVSLTNKNVLVSSVSAVQGILLGLGI